MLNAEKKSLIRFASFLIIFNFLTLSIASSFYYHYQKNLYLDFAKQTVLNYANRIMLRTQDVKKIENLAKHFIKDPHTEVIFVAKNTIVYDTGHTKESFTFREGFREYDEYLLYAEKIKLRYLKDVEYILIKQHGIKAQLDKTKQSIILFFVVSSLIMSIIIVLLSRRFLKPMRDYAAVLDKFIQDTTHELNTPLSVISMSIERIEPNNLSINQQKQLKRIQIASKTISTLYNDLTFLMQYKNLQTINEKLEIQEIIVERICYFRELAEAKKVEIIEDLDAKELWIDKGKFIRIIDNLLSNAIKYNKKGGKIFVVLRESYLEVKDTGIGIEEDKLVEVFDLFKRFDEVNGGFGIGLNLVKMICDEYKFAIEVVSTLQEGTTFHISFYKG